VHVVDGDEAGTEVRVHAPTIAYGVPDRKDAAPPARHRYAKTRSLLAAALPAAAR